MIGRFELLGTKIEHLEAGRPFGPAEAEAMSRRPSPATGKPYGLAAVARVWRVARATLYRHRRPLEASRPKHRPGLRRGYTDEQLLAAIRRALADSPFHGEGYTARSGRGCAWRAAARPSAGCCG